MVIIKLDFEKTFDKVEHNAIIQIMSTLGFGQNWIRWVKDILSFQSIINKATDRGILSLPQELQHSSDFPIVQYADDTLIIMGKHLQGSSAP
jgi:hypothetical protein